MTHRRRLGTSSVAMLQYLNSRDVASRQQIKAELGSKAGAALQNLAVAGYVDHKLVPGAGMKKVPVWFITTKGRDRLNPALGRSGVMAKNEYGHRADWQGLSEATLRAITPTYRPGSQVASTLPSRVGDLLYWPDGAITHITTPRAGVVLDHEGALA